MELHALADALRVAYGLAETLLERETQLRALEGALKVARAEAHEAEAERVALRAERDDLKRLVAALTIRVEQLEPKGL